MLLLPQRNNSAELNNSEEVSMLNHKAFSAGEPQPGRNANFTPST